MVDEIILLVTLSDNALDVFNGKRYRKQVAIREAHSHLLFREKADFYDSLCW